MKQKSNTAFLKVLLNPFFYEKSISSIFLQFIFTSILISYVFETAEMIYIYVYNIFELKFLSALKSFVVNAYNLHKPLADFIELASRKTVETDAFTILCRPILTTSFI